MREILTRLLRVQCAARSVARHAGLEASLASVASARIFVCDSNGFSAAALDPFLARLRDAHPALRVIRFDDASSPDDIETALASARPGGDPRPGAHASLTPLESEVMLSVATGLRNAEIAQRMRRSCKTVEKHRANALRKIGVRNVAQLVAYTIRNGLLDCDTILAAREL